MANQISFFSCLLSFFFFWLLYLETNFTGNLHDGSLFSPKWKDRIGLLLGLRYVSVASHVPLLVLRYIWLHNPSNH